MPDIYYRIERALIEATGDQEKYYRSAGTVESICSVAKTPEERAQQLLALIKNGMRGSKE